MSERLIVDIGSTHVAWRSGSGDGRAPHRGHPGSLVTKQVTDRPEAIIAGSVAAPLVLQEFLDAIDAHWGLRPEMPVATARAYGVRNGYRRPESLGVDRWAAMVAAFVHHGGPVLVVDCGTALTIDCVDAEGRHHGGWIAPGLGLMREALARGTRLGTLPPPAAPAGENAFGNDTEEAVSRGCLSALAGTLERAQRDAERVCGAQCRLLLTGGDAATVRDRLSADWRVAPGLVLDGLALLGGGGQ